MRTRPAAALAAALLLAAGCSTGGQPTAAPELPEPSRELVAWADTVCTNVELVDGLRSHAGSGYYTSAVTTDVVAALESLKTLEASGIKQADSYVGGLVKALERLRDELPAEEADPARITALVGEVGKQQPALRRLAARTRALAPSYHLAPGCGPLKRPPESDTRATRALVTWANTLCEGVSSIAELPAPGDELLKHPSFAQFESMELSSYLTSVPGQLSSIVDPIAGLKDTRIAQADTYRDELVGALRDAGSRLPGDVSTLDLYDVPLAQLRERANQAAATVAALEPKGEELPGLARRHPALADAYHLAPRCEAEPPAPATTTTLPKAKNGTNVAACQGGTCQIEVSEPKDVTVRGNVFTIAVSDGTVWMASGSGLIRLMGAGTAQFGVSGATVVFEVVASTDAAAVLDVSTT
ncbi:hypothetical protein [Prauserella flavalba]|uniref:Uncharacterized protein n=1 Tax=Prauserella flavalba TaxID=1477506 RepID=A0A318LSD4_9PSEU|nr:hypothetical protein [Prauserella flavalba]PXY36234.1 hypothetical protein BA062_12430 [Prauserella flavalba]